MSALLTEVVFFLRTFVSRS